MDRLLRGHNVAYVAAASVVVLICWLVFVAVQPPPPAEEEEADTDTPAGRRAERHKRMLQRAKTVAASKAAEGRAAKVKAVRTTFLVETDAMDVNVTVVRPEDQHTLTIVTVHGAAADHRTTFGRFESEMRSQPRFAHVQFVHIDLPGYESVRGQHRVTAPRLPAKHRLSPETRSAELAQTVEAALSGQGSAATQDGAGESQVEQEVDGAAVQVVSKAVPDWDSIPFAILQVLATFGVHQCVAVGVGQGATALVHASLQQRFAFRVLVLCNPLALAGPSWNEWLQWTTLRALIACGAWESAAVALRDLSLGPARRHSHVGRGVLQATKQLSPAAVGAYISAGLARAALPAPALRGQWAHFSTRILGFVGEAARGPCQPWPFTGDMQALHSIMACGDASVCAWEALPYSGQLCPLDDPQRMLASLGMTLLALGHGGMASG